LYGSSAKVTFTAGSKTAGAFSLTGKCKAGAVGSSGGGTNRDWGYCVLPDDPRVNQLPITPPLVGCEAERFLKAGASAWVVGFGTTGANLNDNGIKREVEVKINKVGNGTIDIGDKDVGACHGDSGGPIYMKLTDGTHDWGYRVFGSTSSAGGNCDCTCSTVYVNIAQHVKAIEQNEMIDVTPCTDADGKWAPSAACKEFQNDPQNATGTYPMCTASVTHDPIATCDGPPPPVAGNAGSAGRAGAGGAAGSAGRAGASGAAGRVGAGGVGGIGGAGGTSGAGASAAGSGAAGSTGGAGGAFVGVRTTAGVGAAGVAAGGGAGQAASAGQPGVLMNGVQVAGAPATGFAPLTNAPAQSHGCQATGPWSGTQTHTGWLLCGLLGMLAVRSRQRRSAAARA
jgi:hypothetical protein